MGSLKFPHTSGNSMSIAAPATNPASDLELKLPATIGTANQVLANSSTPGTLEFATPGTILQVVSNLVTTNHDIAMANADTWYSITTMDTAITPTSNTSKILISGHIYGETAQAEHYYAWRMGRTISGGSLTPIGVNTETASNRRTCTGSFKHGGTDNNSTPAPINIANYIDSPATTSATTYTFQINSYSSAGTYNLNHTVGDANDQDVYERGASWITLMEIAGSKVTTP